MEPKGKLYFLTLLKILRVKADFLSVLIVNFHKLIQLVI